MDNQEFEQKLIEIDTRLKALGDLDLLVQQGQSLSGLITDVQDKKSKLEDLAKDLPSQKEKLEELISEAATLKEQTESQSGEVTVLVAKIEESKQKVNSLIEETRVQLGVAANAKLASTFEQVRDGLIKDKYLWFKWLICAAILLIFATMVIVYWQIKETGTLYHLTFPIRIAVLSPIVYFVVFVNREYGRTRNLIEEYTFKAAVARSFEAYKEIVEATDNEGNLTSTHNFTIRSIEEIYSSPMVNIKKNIKKEKENTLDMISNIPSLLEKFNQSKDN